MALRVDPFALHYFLWFSALTAIYGYISVYAEHYANASSSQYGLLNMILPFVTIVAKLFFCSLADRHQAHRSFFVLFIITTLIGFGSFGVLPFFVSPQPKELGLNVATWSIICIMTSVATISMGVISCLSDAYAMHTSRKNNSSYGFIRVWGTLGWGLSSFVLTFINQTDKLPLLVPGLLLMIALFVLDALVAILWPNADDFALESSAIDSEFNATTQSETSKHIRRERKEGQTSEHNYGATSNESVRLGSFDRSNRLSYGQLSGVKIQWLLFKEVAKQRKSIYRYMAVFTISGALISLQWSYFFLFLKNIYEADFSFISGLSMVGQSMLGELPFFMLSKVIVQVLGKSHTLSLSLLAIGVRYALYEFLLPNSSMYLVLLTESFQGPSFGLFYVVMTEVGLDYSDCESAVAEMVRRGVIDDNPDQIQKLQSALRATMQSLMSACYEGLGLGIGSVVGGVAIDLYGFKGLWLYSALIATILGLANLLIDLICRPAAATKSSSTVCAA